jgi:hypothetical protein
MPPALDFIGRSPDDFVCLQIPAMRAITAPSRSGSREAKNGSRIFPSASTTTDGERPLLHLSKAAKRAAWSPLDLHRCDHHIGRGRPELPTSVWPRLRCRGDSSASSGAGTCSRRTTLCMRCLRRRLRQKPLIFLSRFTRSAKSCPITVGCRLEAKKHDRRRSILGAKACCCVRAWCCRTDATPPNYSDPAP